MTDITTEQLLFAYKSGLFPMAESRSSDEIFWVEPKNRGIIPLEKFHISRTLKRVIQSGKFRITTDKVFDKVIRLCGSQRAGRDDTWINEEIIELYTRLFNQGHVHSIEVWDMGKLVGGLYGVSFGAVFCGESMFHLQTDASKVALAYTVARLKKGRYQLFDVQFLTDHLKRFGAKKIPQANYVALLRAARQKPATFYGLEDDASAEDVLQLIAQTS